MGKIFLVLTMLVACFCANAIIFSTPMENWQQESEDDTSITYSGCTDLSAQEHLIRQSDNSITKFKIYHSKKYVIGLGIEKAIVKMELSPLSRVLIRKPEDLVPVEIPGDGFPINTIIQIGETSSLPCAEHFLRVKLFVKIPKSQNANAQQILSEVKLLVSLDETDEEVVLPNIMPIFNEVAAFMGIKDLARIQAANKEFRAESKEELVNRKQAFIEAANRATVQDLYGFEVHKQKRSADNNSSDSSGCVIL